VLQRSQDPLVSWEVGGIWAVDSQENHYKCCHQMSNLEAKIHQNRFRLGFAPDPDGGAYGAPQDSLAGFKGSSSKRSGRRERKGERGGEGRGVSTPKRYEIGCQLVLISNRKSHTGFRLIPISMTLNDLERHNSPYFVFFTELDCFAG